jgi:hypothetical protein
MFWFGLALIAAGVLQWLATMAWFRREHGSGFDMTNASAFDLRWLKGAFLLGVGVGISAQSWAAGIALAFLGVALSMAVKPILVSWLQAGPAALPPNGDPPHPVGMAGLADAEKRLGADGREPDQDADPG